MAKLSIYNGKEWIEIAKNGKDAVVDYDYILSQIPKPLDGKDGFVDESTVAYLEDKIDTIEEELKKKVKDEGTKWWGGVGAIKGLRAGTNITIDNSNIQYPIISASGELTGSVAWGDITGTLASQTDLQTALDGKADQSGNEDIEITDTTKGVILKSANGTRWRIGITNNGELTATSL